MLPAGDHLALLDFEDEAAVRIEALAVELAAVVMDGHDTAAVAPEHLLQVDLEGAVRLAALPPELREHCVAADFGRGGPEL